MRLEIVRMMGKNKPHHYGGSLSEVEIVTALYFYKAALPRFGPRGGPGP